jgi:hypothetical protein
LRHTYASALAMQGVPMAVIAAQLGHSDTRMTEKHCAHLAPLMSPIRSAPPCPHWRPSWLGTSSHCGKRDVTPPCCARARSAHLPFRAAFS